MPNKNYRVGRRKEYSMIDKLRKDYDIIQRSSGSHSPIDIFAINKKDKKILLIQVKPNNFSEKSKEKIMSDNNWLNDKFEVSFDIAN